MGGAGGQVSCVSAVGSLNSLEEPRFGLLGSTLFRKQGTQVGHGDAVASPNSLPKPGLRLLGLTSLLEQLAQPIHGIAIAGFGRFTQLPLLIYDRHVPTPLGGRRERAGETKMARPLGPRLAPPFFK